MGQKTVYRFGACSENGRQSTLWIMSIPKNKSDIYVAAKPVGGKLKASIHETGKCQASMTSEFYGSVADPPASRHGMKWCISEVGPGMFLALRIIIPTAGLMVDQPQPKEDSTTFWIPVKMSDKATEFTIFITAPNTKVTVCPGYRSMGTRLVLKHMLSNSHLLWLLHRTCDVPQVILNPGRLRLLGNKPTDENELKDFFRTQPESLRTILFCDDLQGGCLFETAVSTHAESPKI